MLRCLVLAAAIAFAAPSFARETLYATSLRSPIARGSFSAGNLYVIDPYTAAATLVGAIKVDETPVGVLALATHPRTGVVYGITAGLTPGVPRGLLEINLEKATGRLIARLPVRGTDIGFDPEGTLYMWAPDELQLVKLDPETASVTPLGEPLAGTAGGALAVSPDGREALVAVNGAQGRLLRIDLQTGQAIEGPRLEGAPYDASIDNLTYSPSGVLYGVNSDGGTPAKAALVTVDPTSGVVARIGQLPDDVRGLIFGAERQGRVSPDTLRAWLLIAMGLAAAVIIAYAISRK